MTTTDARPTSRMVHVNDNIPGAVYIGRAVPRKGLKASKWANPWRVGSGMTRQLSVQIFREYLRSSLAGQELMLQIEELRGKPLACWCRHDGEELTPGTLCHGDVLIALLGGIDDG